jgi:hypothetical protein
MASMSRDVSILNLELSSESDEVKRLYKSYMLLTQCVERLDRIIGMKYGITVRLGTGTATLIANMQNDFADASSLVFTAEKELRASI